MRIISTRVHGMLDYVMGAFLIVSPWLFDFAGEGAATWVPVILGAGIIFYSLFTDYELGVVNGIPMPTHLGLDLAGGILLAVSPWLFNFEAIVYLPHLILGMAEVGAALMTDRVPYRRLRPAGVRKEPQLRDAISSRPTTAHETGTLRPADRPPVNSTEHLSQVERERARRKSGF